MAENEMDEMHRRASAALVAAINAASQLASVAIEYRVRQLRQAALAGEDTVRRVRAQTAVQHAADRATWSPASRPGWWREASVEDISRAWRAAATWQDVDPRAAAVRQTMTERLAEKGVTVAAGADADPGDVQWLRAALDLAEAGPDAHHTAAEPPQNMAENAGPGAVIEGERVVEPNREDRDRMAELVRAAWPDDRAVKVLDCKAWPALAERLHRLDRSGVDVEWLLRGLPIDLSKAHTPAALTAWMVDRAAADLAANERSRGEVARAEERDERAIAKDAETGDEGTPAAREADVDSALERADIAAGLAGYHEHRAEVLDTATMPQATTSPEQRAAAVTRLANPASTRHAVATATDGPRALPSRVGARRPPQARRAGRADPAR